MFGYFYQNEKAASILQQDKSMACHEAGQKQDPCPVPGCERHNRFQMVYQQQSTVYTAAIQDRQLSPNQRVQIVRA